MTSAEAAYLFSHALLRDAAYALQMPLDRAWLHAEALNVMDAPGADPAELMRHARGAQSDPARETEMQKRELLHLRAATQRAMSEWRPSEAVHLARRALELPCATTENRVGAQCMIVTALITQGDLRRADIEVAKALALCRQTSDPEGLPAMLFNAGLICHLLKQAERATRFNNELLALASMKPGSIDHARALKQRGVLLRTHAPEDAAASLSEALALMRALGQGREVAGVLLDRGNHYYSVGDNEAARRDLLEGIGVLAPFRDPLRLWNFKLSLSRVHRRAREYETALNLARESAAIAREASLMPRTADALRDCVVCLRALHRDEEAGLIEREAARIEAEQG